MKKSPFLLLALLVLFADQATKWLVVGRIAFGDGIAVTSWLSIVHWRNTGGVWGIFQDLPAPLNTVLFLLLPLAGVAVLLTLFFRSTRRLDLVLLAAILGGAAGNLADRLRLGAVVDFLDFHLPGGPAWPAFNVADAVLSTGIVLILLRTLFGSHEEESDASDPVSHR